MDQIGINIGLKASFGYAIDESGTLSILPKVTYTNFIKQGRSKQVGITISSGRKQVATSETFGQHLLSTSLGIGLQNAET